MFYYDTEEVEPNNEDLCIYIYIYIYIYVRKSHL